MKNQLLFNPLSSGGKRYGLIIRGNYTKEEIKKSFEEIVHEKVKVTTLNRKSFKQYYINFNLEAEVALRNYWSLMKKELIKDNFDPESLDLLREKIIKKI